MPIHDWTRVDAGIFHDFHQAWTVEIVNALNWNGLQPEFYALIAPPIPSCSFPDVVMENSAAVRSSRQNLAGGLAVADVPPQARFVLSAEPDAYARKANRLVVRHRLGQVVAVIEIVSPGNKSSQHALRSFVEKAEDLLRGGIHLLIVDLFPPSPRDPQGIHKAIWDTICEEPFGPPPDKPLTVAAYRAGLRQTAYVEPVAVGDPLPPLPIFLDADTYVPAPLETTYRDTWAKCPAVLREAVERPDP